MGKAQDRSRFTELKKQFWGCLWEEECKITNIKLLGPLPRLEGELYKWRA
jgi:hypothetical protein